MEEKDRTGRCLEKQIADAYRRTGATKVEHDVQLAGNQIDVYVELPTAGRHTHRIAIESKDWTSAVGIDIVNGFATICKLIRGEGLIDESAIISPCGFTRPARAAADTYGITLLEIADLDDMVTRSQPASREEPVVSHVPPAPQPYLAHPYPIPKNWTGREQDMDELDDWLKGDADPMCCLVAYGGTGKSSLSWAWLEQRVMPNQRGLKLDGVFQWSFYEGEVSVQRFLDDLTAYLRLSDSGDAVTAIVQRLSCTPVLLVLDGFERLLREYSCADAALLPERPVDELSSGQRRCVDLSMTRLLRSIVATSSCKCLLISRLIPEDLDGRDGWLLKELSGLHPSDAVRFLKESGIRGLDRELKQAAELYDFHPMSLARLVNVLHYDLEYPDDIAAAARYDITPDLKARQHHVLERAFDTLPSHIGQFLSRLATLRCTVSMQVIRFVAGDWTDSILSEALRRLDEDRWILWTPGDGTISLHPIVRRYAYQRLGNKVEVHTRLAKYYLPISEQVSEQSVACISEVSPVIESYHHLVGAGMYEVARLLYHDKLTGMLYFRFAAYHTCIELLSCLFLNGEDELPVFTRDDKNSWAIMELANAYSISGQPQRSLSLFARANALIQRNAVATKGEAWSAVAQRSLAIGLCNTASFAEIPLGKLESANESIRHAIDLSLGNGDRYQEAVGYAWLGYLCSLKGLHRDAKRYLTSAQSVVDLSETTWGAITRAFRSRDCLLKGDAKGALAAARRARQLSLENIRKGLYCERDIIRVEALIGTALTKLCEEGFSYDESESRLSLMEALNRCRRVNMVDHEPSILLALAQWHHFKADREQARELATDALLLANRCEYRLDQADIHNFLAQLEMEESHTGSAVEHALAAYERASCDGPPHCYKPALEQAAKLLETLGTKPPKVRSSSSDS